MRYFEDFRPGDVIDLGSFTVSQDEIVAFARQFDPQTFHVDPRGAQATVFKGLIASGWQTASLFMRLFVDAVLGEAVSLGSPGLDGLRWTRPVRAGDRLHGTCTVSACTPSRSKPDRGVVRWRGDLVNQEGVLVMDLHGVNIIGRRPATP